MLTLKEVTMFKVCTSKHESFTVPSWARYVTISDIGTVCAWKFKPELIDGRWYATGDEQKFVKPIGSSKFCRGCPEIIEVPY